MIAIVDYGVGNISSFLSVYKRLNISAKAVSSPSELEQCYKIILPGVGHFDYAMQELIKSGILNVLNELVLVKKVPVLGVCVGMQLLSLSSEEGALNGLHWIDSTVKKIDESKLQHVTKLPHMGWNDVTPIHFNSLFKGLESEVLFYFLHSYYFSCNNSCDVLAECNYGERFTCAVERDNIFGVQFHPEKSHKNGEILLRNFAKL